MEGSIDLPDRSEAFVQLELAIQQARAEGERLLVAVVDIDQFHRINETKGISFGNHVLQVIAQRLSGLQVATDKRALRSICKLGYHSFLVIMQVDQAFMNDCQAIEAVKYAVEKPIVNEEKEIYWTASIGACLYPKDGRTSEQLICRVESALYHSKELGGNCTHFYCPEDRSKMDRILAIEVALRPALLQRQFHLSFQPIYRLEDGRIRGFEALIRWQHPELGFISPHDFIPLAERNGFIIPIGEWVLREACKTLSGMLRYGMEGLIMSINISPVQLSNPAFISSVLNAIKDYGLPKDSIEFELTEHSGLHASEQCTATLSSLRAAGVRISLDHFGMGYSSFAYLKQLPINCVKIDKSFIRQIDVQSAERHIVESMIGLVQRLGLEVIAEGVEVKEQYNLLSKWGCNYVQGFLLGTPMEPTIVDMSMIPDIWPRQYSEQEQPNYEEEEAVEVCR